MKELEDLKQEFQQLLNDKKDFVNWLENYSNELKYMSIIYSENEKSLLKIEGQMELMRDILDYFQSKKNSMEEEDK